MAFSYCLRRSSSIVPLAIRSAFDVQNSRRLLRSPPFLRRFSSTPPPSAGSPTQTSDESLDGLPFDDIHCEEGNITLKRESKNEIVLVSASDDYPFRWVGDEDEQEEDEFAEYVEFDPDDARRRRLFVDVRISYGEDFKKWMEFDVHVPPDDPDRIVVRRACISVNLFPGRNCASTHLDEFEDFFKKRGIGHQNLNFLFNFLQKRQEMDQELSSVGRKVHDKA